jgi:hypothetical protein
MALKKSQGTATLPKIGVTGRAGVLDRFLKARLRPKRRLGTSALPKQA